MTVTTLIVGLIVLWLIVLLVRAVLFKPDLNVTLPKPAQSGRFDLEQAAQHLAAMVRCRTIAPENNNVKTEGDQGAYEQFEQFRQLLTGFYPKVHQVLEYELINRQSLLYRWVGKNSDKPLLLMAHYDVVPAEGDQWKHSPFDGIIEDKVIWGRGTTDNKQNVCAIFEVIESLLAEEFLPEQDIYLAFGHDEETNSTGARAIVETLKSRGVRPEMVLDEGGSILEGFIPGINRPIAVVGAAEKGTTNIEVILEGTGGHSSAPGRFNQLNEMSKIILRLDKKPFKAHLPVEIEEMFKVIGRHAPFGLKIILANLWCFKPLLVKLVPLLGRELNALCRSTCAFTMIRGSNTPNVLPDRVSAVANLRLAARDPYDKALEHVTVEAMAATKKACQAGDPLKLRVTLLQAENATPSSDIKSNTFSLLEQAISETFPGTIVTPFIYLGATDSRFYHAICDNVFRFIPVSLNKEELRCIHGVDEKITLEKLALVIEFYFNLIDRYQLQ